MNTYILQLYAGHGTVAKLMAHIIECNYITVDLDENMKPTLCQDILQWAHND